MSVIKRGNSKNWYIQFQFNGKTYIKSSKTTDKRIAERMEREWKVKVHSHQVLGEKEFIRFSEIMDLRDTSNQLGSIKKPSTAVIKTSTKRDPRIIDKVRFSPRVRIADPSRKKGK